MPANKYPGKCYICGQPVAPYQGRLATFAGKTVPAHTGCQYKGTSPTAVDSWTPDPIDTLYEDNCRDACGL